MDSKDNNCFNFMVLRFLVMLLGKKDRYAQCTTIIQFDSDLILYCAKLILKLGFLKSAINVFESVLVHSNSTIIMKNSEDNNLAKLAKKNEFENRAYVFYPFFGSRDNYYDYSSSSNIVLIEQMLRVSFLLIKINNDIPKTLQEQPQLTQILCEIVIKTDIQKIYTQARTLLLLLCGSRQKYKALKDEHIYKSRITSLIQFIKEEVYESSTHNSYRMNFLLKMAEDLKVCLENASSRPLNWQNFCLKDSLILTSLLQCANETSEEILQSMVLKLIYIAVSTKNEMIPVENEILHTKFKQQLSSLLNDQMFRIHLENFLKRLLDVRKCSSLRNQAHIILRHFIGFDEVVDDFLFEVMWKVFSESRSAISRHFIDLLGAITHNCQPKISSDKWLKCLNTVLEVYHEHNNKLQTHLSSHIYGQLNDLIDIDGYYFDNDSCYQCLTRNESTPVPLRLTTIKFDVRFTASSVMVRLTQTYNIYKIILRIGDLKKTKMVRTLNVYYNNMNMSTMVELRSNQNKWKKAKTGSVLSGQTEIKIEFALPITACNLMFEYVDFYTGTTGFTETVQCPRCSATVSAVPGICSNCGENVFQCHKCRSINYDEKVSQLG